MTSTEKKVLATASIFHAFNDASVVALPAVFPILYTEGVLIRRYSDIGTILLTGLVVAVISQFIIGHKVKVRHYKCCLALEALLLGVFLNLMTISKSFLMLLLFFVGVRIGSSVYHPVGISWISKTFSGKRLDRAMGIQSAFGDLGVLAAFVSTGYLTDSFGWKAPLILWGTMNLLIIWVGLATSRGVEILEEEEEREHSVSWLETFSDLKPFIPAILLGGIAWGVTLGYAPSLLNHKLKLSMSVTGIILGGWMAMGAIASVTYGKVAEIFGRSRTIITAYILITISTLAIGLISRTGITVVSFLVYGVALFTSYPALLSFAGSITRARNRTATFSTVSNLQVIGNSITAYISGFLSDAFGINSPFILLSIASAVVVTYLLIVIRRKGIWRDGLSEHTRAQELRPEDIVSR